ncbi:TetR/AcrR family transcriptional regulator [Bacillus sp. ISL-51]|uniref:TetR/AcrR family transcriptional regulator n=1 Tax=Bacteria TaxID=2 RepID=UPI001BE803B1|nr:MULTISPECIES: TetR/AcrR family transcriptional regulator [Bacteria]MBT2574956.1 TetR/AcrR family transcriptional regulator [Bacillus sp. ISL-51]MBT2634199.1 TetR/AcrR family transcriptional regulator [Bacillus sp. ISL-26]MBT2713766.1 TetR/AcrR family transcriptional regulator [Pseudomonas sp. ISL-88]
MPDSVTADIKQSLLTLLQERDIRRITMKEIAGHANVSRGTLYLYYEDKHAIIEDITEEMKEGLSEALYDSLKHKDFLNLNGTWQKVHPTLSFVDQHRAFFQTMMDRNKMPYFHFHAFFKDVFRQDVLLSPVNANFSPTEQDMYIHYRALYTYAIVLYWLNEDQEASPEAVSGQVWDLISQKRFFWLFGRRVSEHEEKQPADRRVIRTRQALQGSMLDVMAEKKDYAAVTISDIARKSNLRRATFYDHYANKEELLKTIIHQSCRELIGLLTVNGSPADCSMAEAEAALVRLFSALSEGMPLVHFLREGSGVPDVIPEIFRALQSFYLHQPIRVHAGKKLYAYYVASMLVGLIQYRLHEGKDHAPEVLAREFLQFLDVKKYRVILL